MYYLQLKGYNTLTVQALSGHGRLIQQQPIIHYSHTLHYLWPSKCLYNELSIFGASSKDSFYTSQESFITVLVMISLHTIKSSKDSSYVSQEFVITISVMILLHTIKSSKDISYASQESIITILVMISLYTIKYSKDRSYTSQE